jgi:asparagine synthetase A
MDTIFAKTRNVFTVVQTAKEEPRRFGKNGEVLINYDETEEHFRRASVGVRVEKGGREEVERAGSNGVVGSVV